MYSEIGDGIYFYTFYAETMQLYIGGKPSQGAKKAFLFSHVFIIT